MPALENTKHEGFAQAVALGDTAAGAYRDHGSRDPAGCSARVAKVEGHKWRKRPEIARRIEELKSRTAELLEARLGFTRYSLAKFYHDVIVTPAGEVDEHHPLAQEVAHGRDSVRVKTPSKLDAAKALAALCGWAAPTPGSERKAAVPGAGAAHQTLEGAVAEIVGRDGG